MQTRVGAKSRAGRQVSRSSVKGAMLARHHNQMKASRRHHEGLRRGFWLTILLGLLIVVHLSGQQARRRYVTQKPSVTGPADTEHA